MKRWHTKNEVSRFLWLHKDYSAKKNGVGALSIRKKNLCEKLELIFLFNIMSIYDLLQIKM